MIPPDTSIGKVRLRVADIDGLAEFYERVIGLRSVAAPLRAGGRTIAALNVAAAAPRAPLDELRDTLLPPLLRGAERISAALDRERRNGRD